MPWPSFSPKVRLRDSGELQVATRSPSPASPANVVSSAPSTMPSRAVSASPRVISEARVLSPKPEPLGDADGQRDDVLDRPAELAARPCRGWCRAGSSGCGRRPAAARPGRRPRTRSPSRPAAPRRSPGPGSGPERTATRSGPAPVTSQMTSLIRLVVPSSMPFISDSRVDVRRQQRRPLGRGCPAATATGRPGRRCRRPRSASAGSAVARTAVGQPDAGQVVGVLAVLGDRRGQLRRGGRAASPRSRRRRAPWRTSSPRTRPPGPRPGSCRAPRHVAGQLAPRARVEARRARARRAARRAGRGPGS